MSILVIDVWAWPAGSPIRASQGNPLGLSRQPLLRRSSKASQGPPKTSQRLSKASQGVSKASQGVGFSKCSQRLQWRPRGFPRRPKGLLPKASQGVAKAAQGLHEGSAPGLISFSRIRLAGCFILIPLAGCSISIKQSLETVTMQNFS